MKIIVTQFFWKHANFAGYKKEIGVIARIYKGRIDGDSYVNLKRACKKVLYQLVYVGKKFVFFKKALYLINQ